MTSIRAPSKIVIVSQYFAPDTSTTATYLTAIADALRTDFEVLVISGTADSARAASAKTAQTGVVEVGTSMPAKDALVRRALAMVLLSTKMFFATLKHVTKNDVVLSVTTPFTLPYAVALATRLRGASALLLIYDLYPEALVMAGLVQPRSLVTRTFRFTNGLLFRALDAIITIRRDVEELLLVYKGVESRKIKFIPNWALSPLDIAK